MIASSGCVVEKIDAIIAEHGVTYWPSSTDGEEGSTGTGTGTTTSTSTGDADSSAEGGGSVAASTTIAGTDTTDATESTSTGPIGPVCGDGVVEGEETCDDANADADDGCKECARDSPG